MPVHPCRDIVLVLVQPMLNLCDLTRLSHETQSGSQKKEAIRTQISHLFSVKILRFLKTFSFFVRTKHPHDGPNLIPTGMPGGNIQAGHNSVLGFLWHVFLDWRASGLGSSLGRCQILSPCCLIQPHTNTRDWPVDRTALNFYMSFHSEKHNVK